MTLGKKGKLLYFVQLDLRSQQNPKANRGSRKLHIGHTEFHYMRLCLYNGEYFADQSTNGKLSEVKELNVRHAEC